MEEMPSLNMRVQRLKLAIQPLNLPCSVPVTHSGEILTTGKSLGKKPDRRENGTDQQVAKLHYCYMTTMMMMMIIGIALKCLSKQGAIFSSDFVISVQVTSLAIQC